MQQNIRVKIFNIDSYCIRLYLECWIFNSHSQLTGTHSVVINRVGNNSGRVLR